MNHVRSLDTQLQTALFYAVLVTAGGILFSMALSSIALVVTAVLFAAAVYTGRNEGGRNRVLVPNGLEWYFLAWVAAVIVMVFCAQYPQSALGSAKRVLLISMVYFIPAACRDRADVRRFVLLLAIVSGLHSLASIVLFFLGDAARLGVFQHYMTGGGIRMLLLLFLLPMVLDQNASRRDRMVIGSAVLVMVFALVLTQTRSSWIGFAVGAAFLGVLRYRVLLLGLLVLAVMFWLFAPQHYRDRITHMFTTDSSVVQGSSGDTEAVVGSNRSRLRMVETGWHMFKDHPICGVGDGEMHAMYREYVPDAIKDEGGHLHNTYIHVLATHGAIGFAAMLALFVGLARKFWLTLRRHKAQSAGIIALGAMAAFAGFLVNGFAEYNFGDHEIVLILWLITGLVAASAATETKKTVSA